VLLRDELEREQVLEEMVELALGLKHTTIRSRDTIVNDTKKIDGLEKAATDNTATTKVRNQGLGEMLKKSSSTTLMYWAIILFAIVSFSFMYIFIKLFPK